MWEKLSRLVYRDGCQFETTKQLKAAIIESWEKITIEEGRNLINSMPRRLFELIKNKGGLTSY
jgi:hypothetical protein